MFEEPSVPEAIILGFQFKPESETLNDPSLAKSLGKVKLTIFNHQAITLLVTI